MKRIHENKKANSFISFIYFLLIVFIEIYQSLVFTDINHYVSKIFDLKLFDI